jgi:ABC-type transporter Mla MlaB component
MDDVTMDGTRMHGVTVTRIGTQVVVRLSGEVGNERTRSLTLALDEVSRLALQRVVVDLDEVTAVEGAGLDFLCALHERWQVRLLNSPAGLRPRLLAATGPGQRPAGADG